MGFIVLWTTCNESFGDGDCDDDGCGGDENKSFDSDSELENKSFYPNSELESESSVCGDSDGDGDGDSGDGDGDSGDGDGDSGGGGDDAVDDVVASSPGPVELTNFLNILLVHSLDVLLESFILNDCKYNILAIAQWRK